MTGNSVIAVEGTRQELDNESWVAFAIIKTITNKCVYVYIKSIIADEAEISKYII